LEELLKKPYATMSGEKKQEVLTEQLVTYQPGTLEHLRALAVECYRFGYVSQIVSQE
jgi:hypothetical protein